MNKPVPASSLVPGRFVSEEDTRDDDKPTSTTKALLVSLVAPRKFSTKAATPPPLPPSLSRSVVTVEPAKEKKIKAAAAAALESVAAAAAEEEAADTATVLTTDASISTQGLGEGDDEAPDNNGPNLREISEADLVDLSESKDDDDSEEEVTAEEAAAVIVSSEDPEDSEINVEELLRITMANLWKEFHLLNLPTYTWVYPPRDPNAVTAEKIIEGDVENGDVEKKQDEPVRSWIHLQVMAQPASLGIILDRLERIGVGTNCGTLSVFKAELCRTSSLFAHKGVVTTPVEESSVAGKLETDESVESKKEGASSMRESTKLGASVRFAADTNGKSMSRNTSSIGDNDVEDAAEQAEQEKQKAERAIEAARQEWKNAATRLRIEQVREQIVEQAAMSFDFIALLTTASILAGVGLITDNTVVIVASMLVSPIMGPVLALTFGTRIRDRPLIKTGLVNELLALMGCVVIGVFVGLGASFTNLAEETWPTNEMQIRGEATGLLTGIAIAIPSGMAVCLSILGGNTSSLVGVAISASLLPPAVNSGICFVYAIFLHTGAVSSGSGEDANDFAVIGGISFGLTVVNILCIWISGLVMFEIKEVAPTQQKNAFWAKDIKVARELNKDKNPDPVNVSVLRKGIKTALSRKREKSEKPIEEVKFEAPPPPMRLPFAKQSLGATLALQPRHQQPIGQSGRLGSFWASVGNHGEEEDNVRYVGLEDMASLLGFDADDDEIDHAAVARKIGRGRYL